MLWETSYPAQDRPHNNYSAKAKDVYSTNTEKPWIKISKPNGLYLDCTLVLVGLV